MVFLWPAFILSHFRTMLRTISRTKTILKRTPNLALNAHSVQWELSASSLRQEARGPSSACAPTFKNAPRPSL